MAHLTANTAGWSSGLNKAKKDASSFASFASTTLAMTAGNLLASGIQRLTSSLYGVGQSSIQAAGELEQSHVAFTTLLGSSEAATAQLGALRQFAKSTPFQFPELIDASRRLMALGFSAEQTIPVIRIVGDAVGSLGLGAEGIQRVTLALGQMKSKGKVATQEINQLAEAGIPAWEMLAKAIGTDVPTAMKQVEAGTVSGATGVNAVLAGMQAKFSGGMEAQSKTLLGKWSNIQDSLGFIATDIGGALIDGFDLKGLADEALGFLATFKTTWLPGIASTLSMVGQAFGRVVAFFRDGWGQWLADSALGLIEFMANFDLYWQIAQQTIVMWAANGINIVGNFFSNAGQMLSWYGDTFVGVFVDSATFALTVFTNLGTNMRALWDAVLDYIAGNGFTFNAIPLEEGFKSAISKMPQMTKAAVDETTPELDSLIAQLADRQTAAAAAAARALTASSAVTAEAAFKALDDPGVKGKKQKKGKKDETVGAAEFGSKEAASALAKAFNMRGGKDAVEQNTKETVKQLVTLNANIANIQPPQFATAMLP